MAQLAEQLICNQQVNGSSPLIGLALVYKLTLNGWFPEWPKGADCKSVVDDFDGSNPSPSTEVDVLPRRNPISSEEEQARKIARFQLGPPQNGVLWGRGASDESKY